jgi:hypothetical protein
LLGLGQSAVMLCHPRIAVSHLGREAARCESATFLCQVAVTFCSIQCIKHSAPPLLSAHLLSEASMEAELWGGIKAARKARQEVASTAGSFTARASGLRCNACVRRRARSRHDEFGAGVETAHPDRGIQLTRKCANDAHAEPLCAAEIEFRRKAPPFVAHREFVAQSQPRHNRGNNDVTAAAIEPQ